MKMLKFLFAASILSTVFGQEIITPSEFYAGLVNGSFDAVLDIRRFDEWESGHVPNATFVENLASLSSVPDNVLGCEGSCRTIVVYCRTGNRAVGGINLLLENGFNGTIYNGLGVTQWTGAGYALVNTESVPPSCFTESGETLSCSESEIPSTTPTSASSEVPSVTPTKESSESPSTTPTKEPSEAPSMTPTKEPSEASTPIPTKKPSETPPTPTPVATLSPEDFYEGIMSNSFDAILDVRTQGEWNAGHIPNATFVNNLGSQTSIPEELMPCKGVCNTIVVYCASGARAGQAINLLLEKGFQGTIYNGLGVSNWMDAGYDLVTTPSVATVCQDNNNNLGAQATTRSENFPCRQESNDDETDPTSDSVTASFMYPVFFTVCWTTVLSLLL